MWFWFDIACMTLACSAFAYVVGRTVHELWREHRGYTVERRNPRNYFL